MTIRRPGPLFRAAALTAQLINGLNPAGPAGFAALEQAARFAVRDVPGVRAHFLPIAAGDVVLADAGSEIARFIRGHYNREARGRRRRFTAARCRAGCGDHIDVRGGTFHGPVTGKSVGRR